MGFPFYLVAEAGALITGTIFYRRGSIQYPLYRVIWCFVLVSFAVDLIGTYAYELFQIQNGWLYNLYDLYKYLTMAYVLIELLQLKWKYAGFIITAVILGAAGIDLLTAQSFNDLLFYFTVVGDLTVLFLCLYYFRGIFLRPIYENLIKLPFFWLVTGIFLYFLCMFPFHFFWDMVTSDQVGSLSGVLYNIIATISIFIMYGFFSLFFVLCRYPIKK